MDTIFALYSLASLAGLIWLIFWLYPGYCTDLFRQQLFHLRYCLFRDAINAPIPFDHPAYGLLRSTINSHIRYAHRLHLVPILWLLWYCKRIKQTLPMLENQLNQSMCDLDNDGKELLRKYYSDMNTLIVKHLMRSSWLLHGLLVSFLFVKRPSQAVSDWLRHRLARVEMAVLREEKTLQKIEVAGNVRAV